MTTRLSRFATYWSLCMAVGTVICTMPALAAVRLPAIFCDSMVLQQNMAVPIWGWADANEKVTVSFAGRQKTATADAAGMWMVRLDAMPASKTPRELTVAGRNVLTIKDVLIGEVWFCSGQSNMERPVGNCLDTEKEQAAATNSAIRHFKVAHRYAHTAIVSPTDDVVGQWVPCSPDTVGQFTAVGYFFARDIAEELNVPVGLIGDNYGGSGIESWIPPEGFRVVPELREISGIVDAWIPSTDIGRQKYREHAAHLREWLPRAEAALAAKQAPPPVPEVVGGALSPRRSWGFSCMHNAMVRPIIPFAIRGMLWYQGESNGGEGMTYFHKMKALVAGWRQLWGEGDFPFYYVQLANYRQPTPDNPEGGNGWAKLREAQKMALVIPNTGMACAIDIGDAGNIHPLNKQDVGKRLALWALARTYGKNLVYSGPLYKSHVIEGNRIRVSFDSVGGGLIVGEKRGLAPVKEVPGGKLRQFAIAGEDKVWHWAEAIIDGNDVIVSCKKVEKPAAVRYAFAMNPEGANLYNKEGLPAVPFRTDDW